jgi:hypothetical protein
MHWISFVEYKKFINEVKENILNDENEWNYYISYVIHEMAWWESYFKNIFLNNFNPYKPIQLVFWESGPGIENISKKQLPNKNYAFYNLEKKFEARKDDQYLAQVHNICYPERKNSKKRNPTKKDILIKISKTNYLIIDIYPTHAIKLDKDARGKSSNIFNKYTIRKLQKIKNEIKKENPKVDLQFNQKTFCPGRIGEDFLPAKLINKNKVKLNEFINSTGFEVVKIYMRKTKKKKINSSPKNNP